jgi:hypothetical protein
MRTYENRYYQQFLQEINFDMLMITFIEPFAHYHRNIASDINYQLSTINIVDWLFRYVNDASKIK